MASVLGKHLASQCVCLHIHADVEAMFQTVAQHPRLQTPLNEAVPPRENRIRALLLIGLPLITKSCILCEELRWRAAWSTHTRSSILNECYPVCTLLSVRSHEGCRLARWRGHFSVLFLLCLPVFDPSLISPASPALSFQLPSRRHLHSGGGLQSH